MSTNTQKFRLAINGRFLSRRPTGVDRFAVETVVALNQLIAMNDPSVEKMSFRLLIPHDSQSQQTFKSIRTQVIGTNQGQAWEQWDLPRTLAPDEYLLSLCNSSPVITLRQVVVIHDAGAVAMPHAYSYAFRWWYRVLMPLLGKRSSKVLTVSEFSKSELVHRFRIPAQKITVVSEGGEHILRAALDPDALVRFGLGARPYVFAVSSMAAHKNFRLVLAALEHLPNAPFDIAIAGGANSKVFGDAGSLGSDRVHWLGYVSDSELRTLYENAMCFVFPSLYEGFGIPPLEAMNCGCPVLAARAASIPEVCGEAALYFDPHNSEELAVLLTRVAADADLRAELSTKGREQARKFSWENAAKQVISACREAMT